MVEAGGLGSVVVDQHDLGVATGKMAAKILKGQNLRIHLLKSLAKENLSSIKSRR